MGRIRNHPARQRHQEDWCEETKVLEQTHQTIQETEKREETCEKAESNRQAKQEAC